ncbi:MAG: DUF6268 family outer membrane beta-barrel protein [Rubripirellula sp.]
MRFTSLLLTLFCTCCLAQQPGALLQSDSLSGTTIHSDSPLYYDRLPDEIELSRFKKQAIQSVSVTTGYLGDSGLSDQFLDLSIGSGIPLGNFDNLLGVKPRVRIDWIDTDLSDDIPSQLYEFEMQFFYRRALRERLSAMFIFSPSIRSDLTTSKNAFRVFALGLLNWEYIPDRLTLSAGAVYLGRADLPVVPALGLTWTPNRLHRLELRFPTSKYSRRLSKNGGQNEMWAYISGGLGGNTWAITRQSSQPDELSLRDIRLTVGIEKLINGGGGWFAEAGYAMGRQVEFESDNSKIELDDAGTFQLGWRY